MAQESWFDRIARLGRVVPRMLEPLGPAGVATLLRPSLLGVLEGNRQVWGAVAVQARLLALSLRSRGLKEGVVALGALPNSRKTLMIQAAVGAAGGTWCPVSAEAEPGEIAALLAASEAKFAFVLSDRAAAVRELAPAPVGRAVFDVDGDLDGLLEEGGVFGGHGVGGLRPKLATLHGTKAGRMVLRGAPHALALLDALQLAADDVHFPGVPLHDASAATLAWLHLQVGAGLALEADLTDLGAAGVTTALLSPAQVDLLAEDAANTWRPRLVICTGVPKRQDAFVARFGSILYRIYGTAETGIATLLRGRELARHPGTMGRPLPDVSLHVIGSAGEILGAGAEGEIWVEGPDAVGYRDERRPVPQRFASAGDLGHVDAEGYLTLTR